MSDRLTDEYVTLWADADLNYRSIMAHLLRMACRELRERRAADRERETP